jgi:hypothetical protein
MRYRAVCIPFDDNLDFHDHQLLQIMAKVIYRILGKRAKTGIKDLYFDQEGMVVAAFSVLRYEVDSKRILDFEQYKMIQNDPVFATAFTELNKRHSNKVLFPPVIDYSTE